MNNKLQKSNDKMISGVASGIANWLNVDPTIIRLLFVLWFLTATGGGITYLILSLLMPQNDGNFGEVIIEKEPMAA